MPDSQYASIQNPRMYRALRRRGHSEESGVWRVKVYQDAAGRPRWVAISSTAYRDRDGEIVSAQALAAAVAASDASGARGPLRFWHVPGLDIGDCDFQMTAGPGGRFLVESGTFRDPRYAQALKAAGPLQLSIGFVHPADQPGPDGVFTDIAIFERSVVPDGRAANPMTRLSLKERRMSDEKLTAAKALFGPELLAELLAQAATTDKEAQAAGVAYKEADAETTEKAPMPPAEMIEAAATEVADAESEADADLADDGGPLLTEAELDMLAERVALKLAPLFEVEKKMSAAMAELKGLFAPVAQKDDARAQQLAALEADVATLKGEQPRAARSSFTAGVWGQVISAEQAAALKAQPGGAPPTDDMTEQERGAYALIFGNE